MSDNSNPPATPLELSKQSRLTMPLAFVLGLIAVTAAGAMAWTSTRSQVENHDRRINLIEAKVATDHDILVEIRADLKNLVRDKRREEGAK